MAKIGRHEHEELWFNQDVTLGCGDYLDGCLIHLAPGVCINFEPAGPGVPEEEWPTLINCKVEYAKS